MNTPQSPAPDDASDVCGSTAEAWLQNAAERESWAAFGQWLEATRPTIDATRLLSQIEARLRARAPSTALVSPPMPDADCKSPPWLALAASIALLLLSGWGAIRSTDTWAPNGPFSTTLAQHASSSPAAGRLASTIIPTTIPEPVVESSWSDWALDVELSAELAAVEESLTLVEDRLRSGHVEAADFSVWLDTLQNNWETRDQSF